MIAEPNRRKKSALLSWWGLSQWKAMDSVYDGPPNFLFPLYNSVLLPLNGDLHLACQGCRLQSTTLLIFNKPIFAGELSVSLFLSSQHSKHASTLNHFSCVWLFVTLWTVVHKLLCPWDSPGKNTGVGCQALLQEIFQTQGLNPCLLRLLHWQAVLTTSVTTLSFFEEDSPYSASPPKVGFTLNTPSLWDSYLVSHRRCILTGYQGSPSFMHFLSQVAYTTLNSYKIILTWWM